MGMKSIVLRHHIISTTTISQFSQWRAAFYCTDGGGGGISSPY
jgi:hypothetical protein